MVGLNPNIFDILNFDKLNDSDILNAQTAVIPEILSQIVLDIKD